MSNTTTAQPRLLATRERVYEALRSHETDTGWKHCRTSVVARRAGVGNATALRHLHDLYEAGRVSRAYTGVMFRWDTVPKEAT